MRRPADGAAPPARRHGAPLPAGARVESYTGSRRAWVTATARPGDLVLMPAAGGPWIIGIDAAASVRLAGVSVG